MSLFVFFIEFNKKKNTIILGYIYILIIHFYATKTLHCMWILPHAFFKGYLKKRRPEIL